VAEYNLAFSEKLADAARFVISDGLDDEGSRQTVLYLSLLSAEISIKAILEKAGQPIPKIRARSHNFELLLKDLSACEVQSQIAPGYLYWISASDVRAQTVDPNFGDATIGTLLEGEKRGASRYPNEVRYGEHLKHFPAEIMCKMSFKLLAWCKLHWESIRVV
jgi:HEPN domain-containing protein